MESSCTLCYGARSCTLYCFTGTLFEQILFCISLACLKLFFSFEKTSFYRKFHGRGLHLGSGANAAKFTVNVWEKL